MSLRAYIAGVLLGIDQLANTLLFGFPDESLSSRMGRRLKRKRRAFESEAVCAALDAIDPDHCENAIEENPDGSTNARHLGRVIHEIPPTETATSAEERLAILIEGHLATLSPEEAERRVEAALAVKTNHTNTASSSKWHKVPQ